MKMVKSLILGSAAGLVAMSGAQAADLPVKAKAVEYVKICSLYGAGFYYIPGTDTCIKLGGYLRVDTTFNGGGYGQPFYSGDGGQGNRFRDYFSTRSRMQLNVDTRTATEYGVVRTFGLANFNFQNNGNNNPTSLNTFPASSANGLFGPGGGYVSVDLLFIQFAGFTFGKSASAYATPWFGYPGNNSSFLMGGADYVTGVNNIQYTAQFGNGVSATIGLDDPTVYSRTAVLNLGVASGALAAGANALGGTHAPDIVGNVRVDQAWGLFQFSAVAHDLHAAYYGATEVTGHPSDKWGWAAQAALSIKNIPTGPGDSINVQAVYTDGATRYNFQSLFPQSFFMFSGSGSVYQSTGFAGLSDGVFGVGTGIDTVKTWGFRGGFTHNWDPYWASGIYGAYAQLKYGDTGKALICTNFVASLAPSNGLAGCNPDFNFAVIGANLVWTPVKNLAFTADVNWSHLDQKYSGTIGSPGIATAAKPGATYELKDQNSVSMLLRAQRNF